MVKTFFENPYSNKLASRHLLAPRPDEPFLSNVIKYKIRGLGKTLTGIAVKKNNLEQ